MYTLNDMILIGPFLSISFILRSNIMIDTNNNFHDEQKRNQKEMSRNVPVSYSAFISDNPDFDPSRDSPLSRSCDTMGGIIAND
jgi:hypothetical protein